MPAIKAKDRDVIIRALRAGVVPRVGLQHIQVGRRRETEAILADLERIASGGAALRFVIGEYGAGKTFFLFLVRQLAIAKNLVVLHADLSPDKRLHATGGQARALYGELAKNASIRSAPDGGALRNVLERFVGKAADDANTKGTSTEAEIAAKLADIRELAGGYDFAAVIATYARAYEEGAEEKQTAALRWLRGEYSTRTDARQDLGVRTIVDDTNIYDSLKLLSRFVRHAGYSGLFVCVDELVNVYKLQNAQSRQQNFDQILRMLNDVLQGSAQGIGFALGGTPEFMYDTRRGLYSYEALQSRLAQNTFATGDLVDYSGPVVRLQNLTPDEVLVLFERLRDVFAGGDPAKHLVPDEALTAFAAHCRQVIGDSYFRTPRTSVKAFADLLSVLEQNPGTDWRELLGSVSIEPDRGAADELLDVVSPGTEPDDELSRLRL
jgi:P-loop Domain of unknown function (DUF2791)